MSIPNLLPLDSPRWQALRDFQGKSASDMPALLKKLRSAPAFTLQDTPFSSLWARIHHQSSSYTSTFAVVPHLVDIAENIPSERCSYLWTLVGSIAGTHAPTLEPIPDDLRGAFDAAVDRAEARALEALLSTDWELDETYDLIVAAIGLARHPASKLVMDHLWAYDDAESTAICPKCGTLVEVEVHDNGVFVVSQDKHGQNRKVVTPKHIGTPAPPIPIQAVQRMPNPWEPIGTMIRLLIARPGNLLPSVVPHLEIATKTAEAGLTPEVPVGLVFSLIGAILTVKGFSKPAMRYFHTWDEISCLSCNTSFVFAANWWGVKV